MEEWKKKNMIEEPGGATERRGVATQRLGGGGGRGHRGFEGPKLFSLRRQGETERGGEER